jgi:enoyl-CoA hydratase/carnithine racemase
LVYRDEGVVTMAFNRPELRNALDAEQWERLGAVLADLAADPSLRCLVLTGTGQAFASGGDLKRLLGEIDEPGGPHRFRERIHACLETLYRFPVPTIARINGSAIGGGLELSIACDIRIASRRAQFGMPAARFGMVMAFSDLAHLAGIIGFDRARYLALTGQVIDADEAFRIGLVHQLAEPDELDQATSQMTRRLLAAETSAARWFRRAIDRIRIRADAADLLEYEEECLTTDEFRRRVTEFLSR